ncbi:MAG TPA: cytochrome c1 [Burkholderiaceae bacterium]|nr:cytochrome c1 [Burkholderiaceae bacterium]
MKKPIIRLGVAFMLAVAAAGAAASGAETPIERWPSDRAKSLGSLQNGARIFVNYCMGCHSANLVRWNRLQQIGLSDAQIKEFLIFGNQKVGDPMRIAMTPAEAKRWFGKTPPDLSVITRARTSFEYPGTDYIYTLLRGYYRDNGTATGWNNIAYPSIGMPHTLWERQGAREATLVQTHGHKDPKTGHESFVQVTSVYDAQGNVTRTETELKGPATEGFSYSFKPADAQQARQFDSDVADLVAFLSFITDPSSASRRSIGVWVLLFLALFTVIAWRLNAIYWKDIK